MNATMRNDDMTEDPAMPASENETQLAIQVAELRSDVRHVQSDVTDIKADLRQFKKEVESKFERIYEQLQKIGKELSDAKIWALVLYIGLAGSLFYVLAKGFKWL